jgi:hypothetical protein
MSTKMVYLIVRTAAVRSTAVLSQGKCSRGVKLTLFNFVPKLRMVKIYLHSTRDLCIYGAMLN